MVKTKYLFFKYFGKGSSKNAAISLLHTIQAVV